MPERSAFEREAGRPISLWRQRPFRMLSYTRFSSRVAQNALNFGLVLLISNETGKAFLSSLLVLALVVPSTVTGLAAGWAADAFPKRLLVVLGHLGRAGVCILFIQGSGNLFSYYAAAVGLVTFGQFASAAEGAIQPAIIQRVDLTRANAISQAVGGAAQVVGLGVLTPLVLRVFGSPELLFAICAGLFVVAAFNAVLIGSTRSHDRQEVGSRAAHTGPWYTAGWHAMRQDPAVMHAAIELTLISAVLIILGGLIPKYIGDTLGLPVDVGAIVLLPAAGGVVLGLRVASYLSHRVPHAALTTAGFLTFVGGLLLLTFVNQEASFLGGYGLFGFLNRINIGSFDGGGLLAMILMLPLGFAFASVNVSGQTLLNDRVPLSLQGRVQSTQAAMAGVASSLPVLIAGGASDVIGVTPVMALVALLTGALAIANIRPRAEAAPVAGSSA